jgi:hypothetical protein
MNYEVKITECSKELKARERLFVKDTSDAIKLDEATAEGEIIITPAYYAILGIHNEKADDVDYSTYVVVDIAGNKFVTGSDSFFKSFLEIYTEMNDEDEEYSIKVYRLESKNYKGKSFITCSIVNE